MFPDWAVGVSVIIVAAFGGIGLLVRILPPKMRKKELLQQTEVLEDMQRKVEDVDELRRRLVDVEERLDFAERLLATQRAPDRIPPPNT